jgi:hypothetical protein
MEQSLITISFHDVNVINYPIVNSSNIVVRNNIFYATTNNTIYPNSFCSSCSWEKNIFYSTSGTFSIIPGDNYVNHDPGFVLAYSAFNYLADYHVNEEYVAIGNATDGTDIGVYGGIHPFSMFGFDAGLPRIVEFELLNSSAPQGGTIAIQLRATGSGQ